MVENFIPSVLARYREQILFPVLRLFLSVLMSLGTDNQYTVNQVHLCCCFVCVNVSSVGENVCGIIRRLLLFCIELKKNANDSQR